MARACGIGALGCEWGLNLGACVSGTCWNQQEKNLITKDKYHNVLKTGKTDCGENHGFRVMNNRVLTYAQFRDGFSYFYLKRKVLPDGINTNPMDI